MRYYSDRLKRLFDTEEELKKAEEEQNAQALAEAKKKEERTARAKEIEAAYREIGEATKRYNELVAAFVKDYGSFHQSITKTRETPFSLFDLFMLL